MLELDKVYNIDCLEGFKQLDDNSIDLICTDPPYKLMQRGTAGSMGGYWTSQLAKKGKIFDNNNINIKDYAKEMYRVLKDGTILYIMTNNYNLIEMLNELTSVGFHFVKSLIWEKPNKICGKYYMGCYEYILLFRKGKDRGINDCSTPDILRVDFKKLKDSLGKNLHDTEKPVDLMKILVSNSSNEGEVVLDPFSGIGSTLLASKELGRHFIGFEIDKKYYDIINDRLEGVSRVNNDIQLNDLW